jgi:uncharacterized protein (DUF1015 family)
MADIAPLRPLRYDPARYEHVVAPPYDVIDAPMRAELAARDPHNVVHLDLPEGDGDARYENARRLFERWRKEGVLMRDEQPSFWRYAQSFEPPGGGARLVRRGFFALIRAVPLSERVILPHERTLTGPKLDRMKLSRATRATLSPQFMLYADPERRLDAPLDSGERFADFTTPDGIRHEIARVVDASAVARICEALAPERLLIADGHHRYETAVALAQEIDAEARASGTPTARGEHLYTYAFLANGDDPNLVVFPTHRLIHSLPRFDFDDLCARSSFLFEVRRIDGDAAAIARALEAAGHERPAVAAAARGRAALLSLRPDADLDAHPVLRQRPASVRGTAVALLHDGILEHLLDITPQAQALKTNIRYLQDAREGVAAVERGDGQVFFLMNPTPISTIRAVAEAGDVMPQKSTYFHPKVPTGLLFHTLDPTRKVG